MRFARRGRCRCSHDAFGVRELKCRQSIFGRSKRRYPRPAPFICLNQPVALSLGPKSPLHLDRGCYKRGASLVLNGSAGKRTRTSTGFNPHQALNLARLPIPPFPQCLEQCSADAPIQCAFWKSIDRRCRASSLPKKLAGPEDFGTRPRERPEGTALFNVAYLISLASFCRKPMSRGFPASKPVEQQAVLTE